MKSMEEYINEVYQKYEESEKNHEVYKKVKVKYQNPLTTLCGVAACILVLCVSIFSVNKFNKEPEIKYASEETKDNGIKYYTSYIFVDNTFEERLDKLISGSTDIGIVSNISVANVYPVIKTEKLILKTNGSMEFDKILKDETINGRNNVKYSKTCGTISFLELQKNKEYDWNTWEQVNIGKILSEEEKSIAYYNQIPSKGCKIEEGKKYLVFLKYDEKNDIYDIYDLAYGIIEYDPITNMIKNIDTGEFEEFDWSLIS